MLAFEAAMCNRVQRGMGTYAQIGRSTTLPLFATLLLLSYATPSGAQGASQFVPEELSANISARLVFRQSGLVQFWKNSNVRSVVLRDPLVLDEQQWRVDFKETGGVAVLAADDASAASNFTITADCGTHVAPELNFSLMPNAILVKDGAVLEITNIHLVDIADVADYKYTPAQPYRDAGVGYAMWPTIALAPGSKLLMTNVTVTYQLPSETADDCDQYTQRAVFNLQQTYGGPTKVVAVNSHSMLINGPTAIDMVVYNGSNNQQQVGKSAAVYRNVTFECVPRDIVSKSTGLAPGALAAAIAVPVGVALMMSAGLLAWLCVRRRRQAEASSAATAGSKDIEAGAAPSGARGGGAPHGDMQHADSSGDKVTALVGPGGQPVSPQMRTYYGSGSYPGSAASAATSSCSMAPPFWSGAGAPSTATGSSSGPSAVPTPVATAEGGMPGISASYMPGGTASGGMLGSQGYAGASAGRGSGFLMPGNRLGRNGSGGGVVAVSAAASGDGSGRGGAIGLITSGGTGASQPGASSSSRGTPGSGDGSDRQAGGTSGGGGGSGGGQSSGGTGSNKASGGQGETVSSGGTHRSVDKHRELPTLLKMRSEVAVLRDLKIGPLLGQGSYGRVYKGRWKAATVAVKIIEHLEGAPGTASSGGKCISINRESLLATNMSHPNVVQTYHISTMTASQRNTLANTWQPLGTDHSASRPLTAASRQASDKTDVADNSSESSQEEKDILETWMIMEYCEKGSLDRAIKQGQFIRRADNHPELIGIYKALLDTASGLDYLHSIGVVHGDLKTANVLLKGSTRDVRGFACKISDFGLSRVLDMDATHVSTRTYGTIVYMPSELLVSGRMTQATDIYSFGLMMWELLTSQRVFEEGLSIGQIFYIIAYQNWRPPVPPNCPPGYAELMTACWNQDPEQRPAIQQVLRTLQKLYVAEKHQAAAAKAAAEAATTDEAAAAADAAAGGPPRAGSGSSTQTPPPGSKNSTQTETPFRFSMDSMAIDRDRAAAARASETTTTGGGAGSAQDSTTIGSPDSAIGLARNWDSFREDATATPPGTAGTPVASAGVSAGGEEQYKPYLEAINRDDWESQQGQQAWGSRELRKAIGWPTPPSHNPPEEQQLQQEPIHPVPLGLVGPYGMVPGDGRKAGSAVDPIISESVLQQISSSSNARYGNVDDVGDAGLVQTFGRTAAAPVQPQVPASAAQGFLAAIEMIAWHEAAAAAGAPAAASQQAPMTLPREQGSMPGSLREWSSMSTGTMPSVLAQDSCTARTGSTLTAGPASRFNSMMLQTPTSTGALSSNSSAAGSAQFVAGHPAAVAEQMSIQGPAMRSSASGIALQTVQEHAGASGSPPKSEQHSPHAQDSGPFLQEQQSGPRPSPFAFLAQRAGSLFGPVK